MRFLIAVNLFISGFVVITLQAQEAISGCNEVKIQGFCTTEVKVAKDVCKDKDKGEDIKKSFADLKGTKVDTNTNLGKLSQKYRDLEKSSKSEAQQKKACVEVSKAARKDCVNSCENSGGEGRGGPSQADCDKSLDSIDQVIKYCKKNEEAAEEMAMMAAESAGLYDRPNFPTTPTTNGGTTSGDPNDPSGFGSNNINPATVDKIMGYTGQAVSPDGAGSGDATNALSRSLGGGGGGGGSGAGSGSGGGADIGSGDSTSLGSTSAGGRTSGATGLNGNKVGGAGGKDSDSSANISGGKSDGAQGYMFWGVPARKKKAPLTLLKPASTPAAQTQTPERKPAEKTPASSSNTLNTPN